MTTTPLYAPRWIGPDYALLLGAEGFLVECSDLTRSGCPTTCRLHDTPSRANQSREPRLYGWCGTTNNVSVTALGVWRVERMARNDRLYVRQLTGADLTAALEDLGYPDLDTTDTAPVAV